ncbi:hypothetical protein COL154_014162 [Colletotrichum chrysophilum]|nr:hypothetical protein COL154_014162 [Colletotrichum chrysophilum]
MENAMEQFGRSGALRLALAAAFIVAGFVMQYVCLVYGQESDLNALSPQASARLDADSLAYDRGLERDGKLVIAQALHSARTAKSVRRRGGRKTVTDGPFAETKEQLLGFVMVEAKDLDEALEIAAGIPLAAFGTIEVRAIYDIPGS